MVRELPYTPLSLTQDDVRYAYGPDSFRKAEVMRGRVTEFRIDSRIFPGTTRRVWVHVAARHRSEEPAAVMFFNDGWWYLDPDGEVRAGIVLDNLASSGAIPPLVGVFVDPGVFEEPSGPRKNRNAEYDAFDSRYADFLITEVLPLVARDHAVSDDPDRRGICGGSSGGNAAFTTAWMRPDQLRRVIAFNSSFAQLPGGNPYPALLPNTPPKSLRIFLQAAHRDLNWNQPEDNWFAETLRTAAALAEGGYDFRLVVGDGGHSMNHGGVLLPDALRWLWRD